jgi:hypothetical protein
VHAVCSPRGFGIVEITEDLPRPFEKNPAGVGRYNVPRDAQEELHTRPHLDACDHPRYRRPPPCWTGMEIVHQVCSLVPNLSVPISA